MILIIMIIMMIMIMVMMMIMMILMNIIITMWYMLRSLHHNDANHKNYNDNCFHFNIILIWKNLNNFVTLKLYLRTLLIGYFN